MQREGGEEEEGGQAEERKETSDKWKLTCACSSSVSGEEKLKKKKNRKKKNMLSLKCAYPHQEDALMNLNLQSTQPIDNEDLRFIQHICGSTENISLSESKKKKQKEDMHSFGGAGPVNLERELVRVLVVSRHRPVVAVPHEMWPPESPAPNGVNMRVLRMWACLCVCVCVLCEYACV